MIDLIEKIIEEQKIEGIRFSKQSNETIKKDTEELYERLTEEALRLFKEVPRRS